MRSNATLAIVAVLGASAAACKSKDSASGGDRSDEAYAKYIKSSKVAEAKIMLNAIGKAAKERYAIDGAFPHGTVGKTPAKPCCDQPGGTCAPDPAAWQDPVWTQLGFAPTEPTRFQYQYTGVQETFTAVATADLECDGHPIFLTISAKVKDGNPVLDLDDEAFPVPPGPPPRQ